MARYEALFERIDEDSLSHAVRYTDSSGADIVEAALMRDPSARLAWQGVPLDTYEGLPPDIASSWVFVLRADSTSGAERHPNSIQRVMSYGNSADLQTWSGAAWTSNRLWSTTSADLQGRWLSIPANVWHRPVMGPANWTVVSFHTASDQELIEQRPKDDDHPDGLATSAERYAGRTAR